MTRGRPPLKINSRSLLYWWRAGESRADLCARFKCGETHIWRTLSKLREKYGSEVVPYRHGKAVFQQTTCVKCRCSVEFYIHAVEPKYCVECSPMRNMRRAAADRAKQVAALRDEGLTQKAIAARLGVSAASIVNFCRRHRGLNTGHHQPVGDASVNSAPMAASPSAVAGRPSAAGIRVGGGTNAGATP